MDEATNKRLGELIMRLAEGEIAVLSEIADIVERVLMSIGNAYYRNRADVEDKVHDLYHMLCKKAYQFKKNTNAYAWLIKMYENLIRQHLRRKSKENKYIKQEIQNLQSGGNAIDETFVENYLLVQEIFDELTEEERRLAIFYYWSRLSIEEIAKVVHRSKSTIHKKLKKIEEKAKKFQE